ncbi:hypothetical protein AKJ37_05275 [candidate division MSBL1 archaeon SCGC-AAA259I09]|uniref:DUF86 domain-containing protein n=2 Tax=candidate division MSBL1 TaxID=215777 RepID=A0A133UQ73_9EURY|nr:hypothetical protein AKJ37_05275 [candidate division MSBL1 archaeon SCGC-AAA259I09]KXA98518.1 hypothetical protein AKJ39_01785 [candidate division MSBL1 archaeon SCGC-AAA259J03]
MDQERIDRYLEKLLRVRERSGNLEEWLAEGSEPLLTNTERRLATYKAFQEVVEAITDVCAMFAADNEMGVGDDYENLDKAAGRLYDEKIKRGLETANGLRNRIVHEYNKFENRRALENMKGLLKTIKMFEKEARGWIRSR